ncbi:MAG: hypothetical protein PHY30_01380 [Candidatus Pacebacteria bacterium]|nr:hypothetical protein [Candidatus Paceibacterota bacterium]
MAKQGVCFLLAQENVATLISKGGAFHKVVVSLKDLEIDENFKVVEVKNVHKSWFKKLVGGFTFYGITPISDVMFIELRHNKLLKKEKNNGEVEYTVHRTTKRTSWIDLKITNYAMHFEDLETADRNKMTAIVTGTMRINNIYAFLKNRDPYGRLEETLWALFRGFIKEYRTDDLIGTMNPDNENAIDKTTLGKLFFKHVQKTLNIPMNGDRLDMIDFGFEIMNFFVLDINLKDRSAEEAAQLLYRTEKERQATVLKAQGEAERIRTIAQADADKIAMIAQKCKEAGILTEFQMLTEKLGPADATQLLYFIANNGAPNNEMLKKILAPFSSPQTTSLISTKGEVSTVEESN